MVPEMFDTRQVYKHKHRYKEYFTQIESVQPEESEKDEIAIAK